MHASMSSSSTVAALAIAATDPVSAVAILHSAGASGDVEAQMLLAVWHLVGENVSRDLNKARQYLRSAVSIGHVDGALMEIALVANGNGNANASDFDAARDLLEIAAGGDPVASGHLDILKRMHISKEGTPLETFASMVVNESPNIRRFPAMLTPDECRHLAATAHPLLEPAQVINSRTRERMPHPIRTSFGGAIGPTREDLVTRALNLRIAAASGTRVDQGEPLTILRYEAGQQYRPHLDTIEGAANQRIKTMLIYLNEGFGGGETQFPLLPLTVRPKIGDAILFENITPTGLPDARTRHAGLPVSYGVKWMATRWIREFAIDPWTLVSEV